MSSLAFPCIVTLVVLSILPFSSTLRPPPVYDVNKEPLINGKEYIIFVVGHGELKPLLEFDWEVKEYKCPFYITTRVGTDGTPVKISGRSKETNILESERVNLAFVDTAIPGIDDPNIPCNESLEWKAAKPEDKHVYFKSGEGPTLGPLEYAPFYFTRTDPYTFQGKEALCYHLVYCRWITSHYQLCSDLALLGKDYDKPYGERLAIKESETEPFKEPIVVSFIPVNDTVPEAHTSL